MTRNVSAALQQAGARPAQPPAPPHEWRVGDRVEYVGNSDGLYPINRGAVGKVGTVTGLSSINLDSVTVAWDDGYTYATAPRKRNLRLVAAALSPLEAAKKLLEESGYNVTVAPLPPNEVMVQGMVCPMTVSATGVDWRSPSGLTPFRRLSSQTMDKLVEAWAAVKAEEARRAAL